MALKNPYPRRLCRTRHHRIRRQHHASQSTTWQLPGQPQTITPTSLSQYHCSVRLLPDRDGIHMDCVGATEACVRKRWQAGTSPDGVPVNTDHAVSARGRQERSRQSDNPQTPLFCRLADLDLGGWLGAGLVVGCRMGSVSAVGS